MAKMKKINWKSKKTWKNALIIGLACITLVGAVVGLSALFRKSEETTKEINPTYVVGGLTEDGRYKETEESIYTKDAFECQGLDIELDFRSNISYRVFFYDFDGDFLSATSKLTSNYNETETPLLSNYARIVITPNEDDKISWYEKNGYAEQLTITVNKEQNIVEKKDISSQFVFTDKKAVIGLSSYEGFGTELDSTSFKASDFVDVSRFVGKTLEITLPIYTNSSGVQSQYGLVFYDEDKNPIADNSLPMSFGLNSVEVLNIEIPQDAKYIRTTYYSDDFENYDYKGDFYALIIM